MIRRGDIRWFRFTAPDKRRPVLILGKDEVLPALAQIPVIPLSTQARGLPWEVPLTEQDGLPSARVLKPEWIRVVDRGLIGPFIATFPARRWSELREVLLDVLGLSD